MARMNIFKNNFKLQKELIKLYTETDLDVTEIAKHFGVDRHTISNALKQLGIQIVNKRVGIKNNKYIDVSVERIVEMYEDNISISKIAKLMSVDRSVIETRLISSGYNLDNNRRPKKYEGIQSCYYKLYKKYKTSAESRGYEFNINEKYFFELLQGECVYCGSKPNQIVNNNGNIATYNGIDRVDNDKGYTENNCVSCCWICNRFKQTMSNDELKQHISKMYNHMVK